MAGGLLRLIVGAAAGVGGPALGIWLWLRRRCSAASARNHHDRGGVGGALLNASLDGPGGIAKPGQKDANLFSAGHQTGRDEISIPDEISDFAMPASAAARSAAEIVVPAARVQIATESDDRDVGGEHGQAAV